MSAIDFVRLAKDTPAHAAMVARFGDGPTGKRCADCTYFVVSGRHQAHGTERACRLYERDVKPARATSARFETRTRWKGGLAACGRFTSAEC